MQVTIVLLLKRVTMRASCNDLAKPNPAKPGCHGRQKGTGALQDHLSCFPQAPSQLETHVDHVASGLPISPHLCALLAWTGLSSSHTSFAGAGMILNQPTLMPQHLQAP